MARLWKKALSNPRNNVAADIPPDEAFLREILSPDRLDEMTVRYETEIAFEKVMKLESRLSDREIADLRFVLFGMIYRSGIGGIGGNFLKSRPIWQERQRYQKNINSGKVLGNKKGGKKKTLW